MNGPVFVDTNVLLYARDASEKVKQPRAAEWLAHLWRSRQGRLSTQVLHEYYVNVTGKLKPGLRPAQARAEIRSLIAWRPIPLDNTLIEMGWVVEDRYRLSFWDALIVAAARLAGCRYLLSEDLQADQLFEGLRVLNPFSQSPESLLGQEDI